MYESYLAAEGMLRYEDPDSIMRHPEYSAPLLGRPSGAPCAVVTGSKGKGSVVRMTACALGCALTTGFMTSPHVRSFNERFRVNGRPISDDELVSCLEFLEPELRGVISRIPPGRYLSPMGIQAALALEHFRRSGCEAVVLECGKGARYDDVNNVCHEFAAINTVFLEHTRELGPTVRAIASDKAHVMRTGVRVAFSGPQSEEAMGVLRERAERVGCELRVYGRDFEAENVRYEGGLLVFDVRLGDERLSDVRLPVLGSFQARNCALALALAASMLGRVRCGGDVVPGPGRALGMPDDEVRTALGTLRIPGRMEVVGHDPLTLLDACINRASCREVRLVLRELGVERAVVVLGVPSDKDYLGVALGMCGVAAEVVLVRARNTHYRFDARQADVVRAAGVGATFCDNLAEALAHARSRGLPVVILGTTALITDVYDLLGLEV